MHSSQTYEEFPDFLYKRSTKDKSQVDLHWAVLAIKEAPSLPHP